jgi:hypothetical protein
LEGHGPLFRQVAIISDFLAAELYSMHMKGMRVLEYINTNRNYSVHNPNYPKDDLDAALSKKMMECAYEYACRILLRHSNTYIPEDHLRMFLRYKYAL